MSDASGGNERPLRHDTAADDSGDDTSDLAPPERPSLSDERPPPVLKNVPPPSSITVARVLWLFSFAATAVAMLIAFLSQETIASELEETLLRLAPGYEAGSISSFVDVIYWTALASLGVVVTVEAILLAMVLNRRGGARWWQLVLLVVHAGAVVVGSAFLTVAEFGIAVEAMLVGGLALAVAGWIAELLPAARRWFRTAGKVEPAPLD